jgi:hypothetical protein
MKEQRPRIKKVRKEPTRKGKGPDPDHISIPWGRGGSEHRPGLFTKQYLMAHGEACAADVFYALQENLEGINRLRIEIGEKPIRGCTYNSYAKYFFWFILMGFVEPIDKHEPAIYHFLQERHFYRLTEKGKTEVRAWEDPIAVAHPEFR